MKRLLFLILCFLILVGCATANQETVVETIEEINFVNPDEEVDIQQIFDAANTRNREIANREIDLSFVDRLTAVTQEQASLISKEEIEELRINRGKGTITKQEAIEDVNVLFKTIKYGYSLYNKYGEEFFKELEEEIVNKLVEETYSRNDFEELICSSLCKIIDNHFFVEGKFLGTLSSKNLNYYYCYDYEFTENENGYYLLDQDNNKFYFKDCLENSKASLKPTLTRDGCIKYCLTLLENQNEVIVDDKIELFDENENIITRDFNWKKSEANYATTDLISYKWEGDILYIKVPSLYELSDSNYSTYLESANEAKNASAIIIDFRGNGGGAHYYTQEWIKRYSGIDAGQPGQMYHKFSYLKDTWEYRYHSNYDERYYSNFIENDTPIYVLVNKACASATEGSIELFRRINNTLVVGTNTNGCMESGGSSSIYLPNSGINVGIPTDMDLRPEGLSFEAEGHKPDIYCDSKYTFDSIMNLLKK